MPRALGRLNEIYVRVWVSLWWLVPSHSSLFIIYRLCGMPLFA